MQLNFKLRAEERLLFSLGRFHEGEWNRIPLAAAKAFGGDGSPMSLVITGPAGCGKSHLIKGIAAEHPEALFMDSAELIALPKEQMRKSMKEAAKAEMVLLDDIDSDGGELPFYDELFHLFNELKEKDGFFCASMGGSPASDKRMPDYLYTRLLSGMVVEIHPPGDEERREILKKLASDRQVRLTDDGANYILTYGERSIASLVDTMNRIEERLGGKKGPSLGPKLIKEAIEASR